MRMCVKDHLRQYSSVFGYGKVRAGRSIVENTKPKELILFFNTCTMRNFRQNNKDFRVFVFTTLNALIVFAMARLGKVTDPNLLAVAPFLIAVMNMASKWINTKLLGDV